MTRQAAEHPVRHASCKHLACCRCAELARLAAPNFITVIGFTRSVLDLIYTYMGMVAIAGVVAEANSPACPLLHHALTRWGGKGGGGIHWVLVVSCRDTSRRHCNCCRRLPNGACLLLEGHVSFNGLRPASHIKVCEISMIFMHHGQQ